MIKNYFYVFLFVFLGTKLSYGQLIIAKPTFVFSQACANPVFNTFEVQINFSVNPSLSPTNQFVVELSDRNGDFSSATIVYTTAVGEITSSGQKVNISFPTNTSGESYQLRVKSTVPAVTGSRSDVFAAYYKAHDEPFTINNSVATATYCTGGSYILSIDPEGNGVVNSPLKYPSLTYNWFRDNGVGLPRTLLLSAGPANYTVTQPGTYYAETNYGSCTTDSFSNRVQVSSSTTTASASISSSKGNPFCAAQGATTLSVGAGNTYQWFKDDVAITGATSQNYQANAAGKYSVRVDYGGCQANATIQLQEFKIVSSIDAQATTNLNVGEQLDVTVTTDATSPTYQWFLNSKPISNATSKTYSVTSTGNYKVVITQAGSCTMTNELPFVVNFINSPVVNGDVVNVPNLISPNGDAINDTWIIPQEFTAGSGTKVLIISSNGEVVLQTDNYLNDWPSTTIDFKNINPVYYYIITTTDNKVIKGSITVIK